MPSDAHAETVDPRIRRTRELLQQALEKLLKTKDFDKISVHEIAEAATVNRATFYDHYSDKFALLECLVAGRFHALLAERQVRFDQRCESALQAMALAICDYLATKPATQCESVRQFEPHMEAAIIAVVRRTILDGFNRHALETDIPPEMIAATVSWGLYGAAKEWVQTPNRRPAEEIAGTVAELVSPILLTTRIPDARPAG